MSESLRAIASRRSDHHAAKRHWSRKLLAHPERGAPRHHKTRLSPGWNVVGVGIGEKFASRNSTGLPAIKFLVRKKVSKQKLGKIDVLPLEWNGLLTDVEEVGEVRFLSNGSDTDPRQTYDPVQPGCSIGYKGARGLQNAGTLSALVEDSSGRKFFLSAFHVLSDLAAPDTAFDITQPGTLDDPDARIVGRMVRGIAPNAGDSNRIDAALADVGPNVNTNAEILGIGAITGTRTAVPEMTVEKFGRNNGYRSGYVFNVYFDISVPLPGGEARFVDQIAILGLNGLFAGDGDSGSLVLERESNRAVGLLFVQAGNYSLANHISNVLSGLGVVLAS